MLRSSLTSLWVCVHRFYPAGLLGIAHGISDAVAGYLLGQVLAEYSLPLNLTDRSLQSVALLFFLYNAIAFGGQPIAGQIVDRYHCPRLAIITGLSCQMLALNIANYETFALGLAGIGSAAFHVGGGALALTTTLDRMFASGLFTAPGVLGLAMGGVWGIRGIDITWLLIALLAIVTIAIARVNYLPLPFNRQSLAPFTSLTPEKKDWILLTLISAIALVSTIWTTFQWVLQDRFDWLIKVALMTAIVKLLAGLPNNQWHWRHRCIISLLAAFLLLAIGRSPIFLFLGLALLQSTVPLTLVATARLLPGQPATATGFALGMAVFLGGLPIMAGIIPNRQWVIVLILMAVSFLWQVNFS